MLDLSENNVTDEKVQEFTEAVYKSAGLAPGANLTFADFKKVFGSNKYAQTLKKATLELNGKVCVTTYFTVYRTTEFWARANQIQLNLCWRPAV